MRNGWRKYLNQGGRSPISFFTVPLTLTPVNVRRVVRIALRLNPVVARMEARIAESPGTVTRLVLVSISSDELFGVDVDWNSGWVGLICRWNCAR